MPFTAIVGTQWGDEGKGRIVDYLAHDADMVIRYQGGNNAGHTVINDRGCFKLHLIPSGIFRPGAVCVLGPGTVVDPVALLAEMDELAQAGIDLAGLRLSERAHLVLPYHIALDKADEAARAGGKIGSTLKGIAWAYADKTMRTGMRAGDLVDPARLGAKVEKAVAAHNRWLQGLYGEAPLDWKAIHAGLEAAAARLRPFIVDTLPLTCEAHKENRKVLLEGQLGIMRDLDWGDYPFVTSSSPSPAGAGQGSGIPPRFITRIVGVVKAYTTSVGEGPLPTELVGGVGDKLREVGGEYGATTGRPRRCGWFDVLPVRLAVEAGGVTELALTKLDVLDGFESLKLCVAYEKAGTVVPGGKRIERVPFDLDGWKPVYEEMPGWKGSTKEARSWKELPKEAQDYAKRISELSGAPLSLVSVGPKREELIVLDKW